MNTREQLDKLAAERIIILDGAMGSLIQSFKLGEADFRGSRFAGHKTELLGCNDLLCLTRPELISGIHRAYLEAGADITKTCSFNATSLSLGDYGIADLAYEISRAAAALARKEADGFSRPGKPRFVAGSMGPTAKSGSISPDMNDPGRRGVSWDELEAAYYDNARGLLDGGADILLLETVFDTLNAKAAVAAIDRLRDERREAGLPDVPLMISATVSDTAGRLLSGQTVEAFCVSVLHARPWSLGLNCSFGAERLKPHVRTMAAFAPCLVSAHPNAGLPNQLGAYDETPESMSDRLEEYAREGLVNILGGCCGSTPAHIAAIAARVSSCAPRTLPPPGRRSFLAGLEALPVGRERGLIDIGERTNVAGSRKFLRLIKEENYREALGIAREMIAAGAGIIDLCMDDALLDAEKAMTRFINLALSEPDIARLPLMVDSSRWEVILGALKLIQGKSLVNSLSLKEGEAEFLRKSRMVRRFGAALVVMLFDERGQAASYQRKIEVARRAYRLLTGDGFPPEDIVFDPNVLTVATGMAEHDSYALDFIRACAWIRDNCPGAQISGGISNLSFSFRGNEPVREAMHAVFLKHTVEAGLSLAILNPAALASYDELDPALRDAAEAVILHKNGDGGNTDRLLGLAAAGIAETRDRPGGGKAESGAWRGLPPEDRIAYAMVQGLDDYIEADVLEIRPKYGRPLEIVEGPLMKGMEEVGTRFGQGKLFLPQVIRSARVMKKAVAALEPFLREQPGAASAASPRVLLATVRGDVHDIGKNIVALVLGCNGYDIVDLGVMVPAEQIVEGALREGAAVIGLSGLITPSLDEMVRTAQAMERRGLRIPLLIGGAAASLAHTSLRIAPAYSGPVVYVPDASRSAEAIRSLLSAAEAPRFLESLERSYREAAARHESIQNTLSLIPLEEARKNRAGFSRRDRQPAEAYRGAPEPRVKTPPELEDYPLRRVIPHIDWTGFLRAWDLVKPGDVGESREKEAARDKLLEDARGLLDRVIEGETLKLRGLVGFFPALSAGDDLILYDPARPGDAEIARFSFLRNQEKKRAGGPNPCLADFILPREGLPWEGLPREGPAGQPPPDRAADWVGLFVLSAGFGLEEAAAAYRARGDDYGALLLGTLANALTEAFSEELHQRVRREFWAYAPEEPQGKCRGIRPAFGYPACPDHEDKRIVLDLLQGRERRGFALTESAMLIPAASVCGLYFAHPGAYYFGTGPIGEDQLRDWAARKGISPGEARRRIGRI
jgi:5-methyltetrahydrofolate--homocysteine methyltransferase